MLVLIWSSAALLTGFALDMLLGDPRKLPHIVRWMGTLIAALEQGLRRVFPQTKRGEQVGGVLLVVVCVLLCAGVPLLLLSLCFWYAPVLAWLLESLLIWQLLAATSLRKESMKVFAGLRKGDVEEARYQVSLIVGRDTATLDERGITRATVETIAENASDGVVAPLFFIMLGGAPLGCLYKAANTMDSMVGYKNAAYRSFGWAAARFDDFLNYLPSRLCALLMIASAPVLGFKASEAARIWRRDRRKHASPNSAQTEAVCAGALGIQLAGPTYYEGKLLPKPFIGDDTRPVALEDIPKANRLMMSASLLMLVLAVCFRALCLGVVCYAAY